MMRSLKFLIGLLFSTCLLANSPNKDSLFGVANNVKLSDTSRINALYAIASQIHLYTNPDSAFYYADSLENWAVKLDLSKQVARAKMIKGVVKLFTGKTGEAENYLNESVNIASSIQDFETLAFATSNLGAVAYSKGNYGEAIDFFRKTTHAYESNGDYTLAVGVYNNIGSVHSELGNLDSSIYYFNESLRLSEMSDDLKGKSAALLNLGTTYKNMGDLQRAMENYDLNIRIIEEIEGPSISMVTSLQQKGILYFTMSDYDSAKKQFKEALEIAQKISYKEGEAKALSDLSSVYKALGEDETVYNLLNKAVGIQLDIGDKKGLITSYNALAAFYIDKQEHNDVIDEEQIDSIINYASKSLTIAREIGNKRGEIEAMISLAQGFRFKGELNEALDLVLDARKMVTKIEDKVISKRLYLITSFIYRDKGLYKQAYDYFINHIKIKEELDSEENQKAMMRLTFQSEYDKQKAIDQAEFDLEIQKRDELARKEREKRNLILLFVILIVLVVSIFSVFLYRRYKLTLKQKSIIEQQKEVVEEKQQEVLDSITYAKRIQDAILPSNELVSRVLKNGFVYFNPKDIVSGDFYWMEELDGKFYIAAADCTGHGVPGAMVSVVCSNALSKALLEERQLETGKLLDRTRELVVARFAKSKEKVKDGMDISLFMLDQENNTLEWAGANNPLWIIRGNEVLVTKPNKQPIGLVDNPEPFTTHRIEFQKGDIIYVFSDGFQDQFGGKRGKKFKPANLKKLLLSLRDEKMEKQLEKIDKAFLEWKGELEQLDDVCVIGVRL